MRLSHKKKIAHKKGTYRPCLALKILRARGNKWHKRHAKKLAKQFKNTIEKQISIEINCPGGQVDHGGMVDRAFGAAAKAFRRLASVAARPFKAWLPPCQGVTGHNKTINQV